jgi:hypothetical protein
LQGHHDFHGLYDRIRFLDIVTFPEQTPNDGDTRLDTTSTYTIENL